MTPLIHLPLFILYSHILNSLFRSSNPSHSSSVEPMNPVHLASGRRMRSCRSPRCTGRSNRLSPVTVAPPGPHTQCRSSDGAAVLACFHEGAPECADRPVEQESIRIYQNDPEGLGAFEVHIHHECINPKDHGTPWAQMGS